MDPQPGGAAAWSCRPRGDPFSRALVQARRWALPLLWEFGVPAAIAILPPAMFKVSWKGMFL